MATRREIDFTVFDEIHPLVLALQPDGPISRWNAACSMLTGYTLDEVQGRQVWDFLIPPEEVDAVRGVFASLRAGEFPSTFVNDWVTKSGERRTIRWSNTCVVDEDGSLQFILATGVDVSTRTSLAPYPVNADRPALTLKSSFPMWVFDRGTLQFLAVNDAAIALYGYTREEFLSMTVLSIRTLDEVASMDEALIRLREGVEWLTAVKHRSKTGEVLDVEVAITPVEFRGQAAAMVLVKT